MPFGETFTCPSGPLGAVATKKTGCASIKVRSRPSMPSYTFPMHKSCTIDSTGGCVVLGTASTSGHSAPAGNLNERLEEPEVVGVLGVPLHADGEPARRVLGRLQQIIFGAPPRWREPTRMGDTLVMKRVRDNLVAENLVTQGSADEPDRVQAELRPGD